MGGNAGLNLIACEYMALLGSDPLEAAPAHRDPISPDYDVWAKVYDRWHSPVSTACLDLLTDLAGSGPVLELGIGTGRIAHPLHGRGIEIHGIDVAPEMVKYLRERPGGEDIPVTLGTFADFDLDQTFELIFVAFNTFFCLLSQEEQISCFHAVRRHLTETGRFLVEAFIPDLTRFDRDQRMQTRRLGDGEVVFEASQHNVLAQRVTTRVVRMLGHGNEFFPIELRYAWPSEMDLMARLAGLRLTDAWGTWERGPVASSSPRIAVYGV